MYRLETGEYEKLIVKNQNGTFEIYINTQLGTLLVYGKALKLWKFTIRFWLHWGDWIKDYYKLVKIQKKEDKINKKALILDKRLNKKLKSSIKHAYNN